MIVTSTDVRLSGDFIAFYSRGEARNELLSFIEKFDKADRNCVQFGMTGHPAEIGAGRYALRSTNVPRTGGFQLVSQLPYKVELCSFDSRMDPRLRCSAELAREDQVVTFLVSDYEYANLTHRSAVAHIMRPVIAVPHGMADRFERDLARLKTE